MGGVREPLKEGEPLLLSLMGGWQDFEGDGTPMWARPWLEGEWPCNPLQSPSKAAGKSQGG